MVATKRKELIAEKVVMKFLASLDAQSLLHLMFVKNLKKTSSVINLPKSGGPRTPATPRVERAVRTVLHRNRLASLHRIAADVRKHLISFYTIE